MHSRAPLPGDAIIDGGNADYLDTLRRSTQLAAMGLNFIDVGVSGGVWGLENGYGLMFGGPRGAVEPLLPIFRALAPAPDRGWVHCGPTGSGHYAKMVHNGIEYGLMQAYAEGLALLHARSDFGYDLAAVTEAWRSGTVIRSWLLDLAAGALRQEGTLEEVAPVVADSGEGRWSVSRGARARRTRARDCIRGARAPVQPGPSGFHRPHIGPAAPGLRRSCGGKRRRERREALSGERRAGSNHLPALVSKAYRSRSWMEVDHEPNRPGLIADDHSGGPGAGRPRPVFRGGRTQCDGGRGRQHHGGRMASQQLTLNYSGFTTRYSCDGIENKVREILLAFGARKDLKVRATGCNEGASRPSRFAWVRAEFNTLAPATDPGAAAAVKSAWTKVQIAPHRPDFMGAGECELVEQMKDMLQKGFALRNAEFRTSCVPYQVSMADYSLTAEVLKTAAP